MWKMPCNVSTATECPPRSPARTSIFVPARTDIVQQYHTLGQFCEAEEPDIITAFLPKSGGCVDIGSNVRRFLYPRQIVLFGLTLPTVSILKINLTLNSRRAVIDLIYLGD